MQILTIVIGIFLCLEIANIVMLYFFPEMKQGNGLGVFNAYEKSKKDPEIHALVRYLVNWVAGTKIIFIALLIVILIQGNESTILWSTIALIVSILTFYWRLYPIIKQMDKDDQLAPKGYSKTLAGMITVFILVFVLALAWVLNN